MINIGVIYTFPSEIETVRSALSRRGAQILPQSSSDNPTDLIVYSANQKTSKTVLDDLNNQGVLIRQVSEVQNVNPSIIMSVDNKSFNLKNGRYKCIFETKSPVLAITAANIAMLHDDVHLDNLILSGSSQDNTVLVFSGSRDEVEAAIKSTKFITQKSQEKGRTGMDLL
ncbi:MAG TPA: hypothetical protein PKV16_02185 [Caldisericia bacterium]|nr:hypothetical protein [Caldisericia bacterium]HPF48122.1 hypothetical protein [Caldisericia bacterium]HPI83941.1 hypothetical protein [Caldisericia bacterium]HPQ92575.1 hypothetical protein [Caldisericia bacterium]HRV74327.1 hypothetical protein [Caldisericia bacterium]